MKKLKLEVDDLKVESFAAGEAALGVGTVRTRGGTAARAVA